MEFSDDISNPQEGDADSGSNLIGITWDSAVNESVVNLVLARLLSFKCEVESWEAAVEPCGPLFAKSQQHLDLRQQLELGLVPAVVVFLRTWAMVRTRLMALWSCWMSLLTRSLTRALLRSSMSMRILKMARRSWADMLAVVFRWCCRGG